MLTTRSLLAAGLSVSPPSIDNGYTGSITLQITSVSPGETVLVEHFVDADGNGTIGAGDPLVQSFKVTDGQVTSFGGVRDMNVPGDEDSVAGQITTSFVFSNLQELARLAGAHLIRVSSPGGNAVQSLTVTQAAAAQSVSGTVTSGGSAVPYAAVGLLEVVGTDAQFVAGGLADNTGHYSLNAAPGTYALIPVKAGFVSGFGDFVVSIGAGQAVNQDLTMTAATRTISGAVTDSVTSQGIAGLQLLFQAQNSSLAAIGFSDANGSYSIGVASDQWKLDVPDQGLASIGYLHPAHKPQADTTTASATLNVQLAKETALIHGTLMTDTGTALAGVYIFAGSLQDLYEGSAITDAGGNYSLGVLGGETWYLAPDNQSPLLAGYIVQGNSADVAVGQAIRVDFTATHATAHLTGQAVDPGGSPVSGLQILAVPQSGGSSVSATTAGDGSFDLGVYGGNWFLQLETQGAAQNNVVGPTLQFAVTDGVDISGIVYIVRSATQTISGVVTNSLGQAIANVNVNATTTVNTTNYMSSVQTDGTGHYQLGAFNSTWQVSLDCGGLSGMGYGCPAPQNATINNANAIINFLVPPPVQLSVYFRHFIYGGEFGSGLTPTTSYPISITKYQAALVAQNDLNYPPPGDVYFTGPAGSGLNGTPATSSIAGTGLVTYFSPDVSSPAIAPGGTWTVIYNGNPADYIAPNPQAASRLFMMVPTAVLNGSALASVGWTFKDANGGALGGPPAYVANLQVMAFDRNLSQLEVSAALSSTATGYSFGNTIQWTDVGRLRLGYVDDLGNRYYLNFNRATPTLGSLVRVSNSQFQFQMTGLANQTYQIDYSTTLSTWFPLYSTNSPSGVIEINDFNATDAHRFYRVHSP